MEEYLTKRDLHAIFKRVIIIKAYDEYRWQLTIVYVKYIMRNSLSTYHHSTNNETMINNSRIHIEISSEGKTPVTAVL